jgi:hypothetical protein
MELYRRSRREHAPPKTTPSRLSAGRLSDKCSEQEKQMYSSTNSCDFSQNPITDQRKRKPLSTLVLEYNPGDEQLYHQDAHAPRLSRVLCERGTAPIRETYPSKAVDDPDEDGNKGSERQGYGSVGSDRSKCPKIFESVWESDDDEEEEQQAEEQGHGKGDNEEGDVGNYRLTEQDEGEAMRTRPVEDYSRRPIRQPRRQSLLSEYLDTCPSIMTASGKGTSVSTRTTTSSVMSGLPSSTITPCTSVASSVAGTATASRAIEEAAHAGCEDTSYAQMDDGQAW